LHGGCQLADCNPYGHSFSCVHRCIETRGNSVEERIQNWYCLPSVINILRSGWIPSPCLARSIVAKIRKSRSNALFLLEIFH
jgi:hypothetical protein